VTVTSLGRLVILTRPAGKISISYAVWSIERLKSSPNSKYYRIFFLLEPEFSATLRINKEETLLQISTELGQAATVCNKKLLEIGFSNNSELSACHQVGSTIPLISRI